MRFERIKYEKNNSLVLAKTSMGEFSNASVLVQIEVYAYLDPTDNLRITSSGPVEKDGTQFYIERLI